MIEAKEHFYNDNPNIGHPDVRTRLKDVSYFFLGNGVIQAAVQVAPSGEGTPIGLIIMNPEQLSKKRESLSFGNSTGLEDTLIKLQTEKFVDQPQYGSISAEWLNAVNYPVVNVDWKGKYFNVNEKFYFEDLESPFLIREVEITNHTNHNIFVNLKTGVKDKFLEIKYKSKPNQKIILFISYELNDSSNEVEVKIVHTLRTCIEFHNYWKTVSSVVTDSELINHFFNSAKYQLPAVISKSSVADASMWQYNREWVRDHSMILTGLLYSGHFNIAKNLLVRLIEEFVTEEGDTIDSSVKRSPDEVELDQNGELLYAIEQYYLWTGDLDTIQKYWNKIILIAEFPLKEIFRHNPSGLLINCREYWERHNLHGIKPGMELTSQLYTIIGLKSAANLARRLSLDDKADYWESEADRIKTAMIEDPQYSLIEKESLIKRINVDGTIQDNIIAKSEALLPRAVPLAKPGNHYLNPDISVVLPIAMNLISPDSPVAKKTLESIELLWNQEWSSGGYGRYNISSEPDSPGAWAFPSLFAARAYAEMKNFEKVWRVLNWLNSVPGASAGSWFEFYGERISPPFPQVGILPWTWAELLKLIVHHIVGVQLCIDKIIFKPNIPVEMNNITCSFRIKNSRIDVKINRIKDQGSIKFTTNGNIIESKETELIIEYPGGDILIEAII
ncbi:hypothetical protein ACFLS9_06685 [Bacteroidota bacterium]